MTRASPLGLRLFLEGVEVPVIAAQVHLQPNTPATATIQIVPTDAALALLPRTLVHLFYLDDQTPTNDSEVKAKYEKIQRPAVNRFDAPDEQYKILFTGEVIGYNFQKTPINRAMILQCMDLSSYWDTCYQWFADWSVSGNAMTDRSYAFVGGGAGLFDNVAGDPKSVIADILRSAPKNPSYRKTRGLLGGMISLLETIGGIRPDKGSFAGYRGVNDFFSIAELRYKLTAQIGALESDKTSANIYSGKAFLSWLQKGISSLGTLVSFRQIIMHVSRYVYHDIYPNPAAYYIPSEMKEIWVKTTKRDEVQGDSDVNRKMKLLLEAIQTARKRLYDGAGGATEGLDISAEMALARLNAFPKFLWKALRLVEEIEPTPGLDDPTKTRLLSVHLMLSDALIESGSPSQDAAANKTGVNIKAIRDHHLTIEGRLARAFQLIRDLLKVKASSEVVKADTPGSVRRTVERGGHLFTQLILPESFFLPPPRCNVLFPDQYTQFAFSRNFMQEVTRLSCSGGLGVLIQGDANSRRMLGSYYFAPNIKAVKEGSTLQGTYWRGGKVILPHEIHSGIIPKMEFVEGGNRWGAQAASKKGVKNIPYIQRLANFQFFMHRWASRSASVVCAFNPRLVLGLPSLVVDRSAPAPAALKKMEELLGRSVLPTQYLGKIASLSHDVSQSGGQTQVMLSHCRTHRSLDDEFLGILDRNIYDSKKEAIVVKEMKNTSGNTSKKEDRKTRLFLEVVKNLSITLVSAGEYKYEGPTSSLNDTYNDEEEAPYADTKGMSFERAFEAKGLVGTYVKGYGTITGVELSGSQILTASTLRTMSVEVEYINPSLVVDVNLGTESRTYRFPEKIVVSYSFQTGDVTRTERPIEELIMPGWYDSSWYTENIGEGKKKEKPGAYLSLLGCGAITDDAGSAEFAQAALYYRGFEYTGPSIEKSVDGLSMMYGVVKDTGDSVHEFIRNYTDRPIANLVDILGTADYDPDAGEGTEGFHSNAFGDYNADVVFNAGSPPTPGKNLLKPSQAHLVPKGTSIPRRTRVGTVEAEIPKYLDPRGRARLRVKAYMEELSLSRGLKG
jgi:hypothetical protein